MNPELEKIESTQDQELLAETDFLDEIDDEYSEAEKLVTEIVGTNIPDLNLENKILNVVRDHFITLRKNKPPGYDIFQIPTLIDKITNSFRGFEAEVHQEKIVNEDLNELARLLSSIVNPGISAKLYELTVRSLTKKS